MCLELYGSMEQTPGYFVLIMSLVADIASPCTAFPPDLVVFSWVSWNISAASQEGWGTQGLPGSGAAFVRDQDCLSARALPSMQPFQPGDRRFFD